MLNKAAQETGSLAFGDYWLRIYRRRWLVVGCLVLGWVVGTALGWFLPSRYRSETVILIEQQKVPEHYVESNVPGDMNQRLQSISEQILSRTRLQKLIRDLHLYNVDKTHADPEMLVERMRKDISIDLVQSESSRNELAAFKVSYIAPSAKLANQVTGELTSLFINENLRNREQLSEDTTSFLQSQLEDARKSLSEQEERLRQFRTQYLGALPEQMTGNLQILGGLQAQLQASTDALNQAEQHNLYLRSLAEQYRSATPVAGKTGAVEPLTAAGVDQELEALRTQLADLSGRYKPMHPDILRLKEQIAHLESQKSKVLEAARLQKPGKESSENGAPAALTSPSSPLIQIKSELSANELEISTYKAKIQRFEQQVEHYQGRLNLAPAREQQYAAITRDYDQSRTYYESLLSKKLQSEMATNLEKRRQGEQFRMIDPPNLPERPYWPNRLAFAVGGLGAGLALGLGLVLLLEIILNPRIYQEGEINEFIGTGFILGIPALSTETEDRAASRLRRLEAIAAGLIAIVIPAMTLFEYYKR